MTTVRITDAGGNKPSFVQWDVDRVVIVSGVTSQPMLHFANAELKRAIVVPTEETSTGSGKWKADVPNFILQFPLPIVISVFLQPEGGEGRTVATVPFGVRAKPKPQDYTYEENIGYINWVQKSEEVQDLIDTIQEKLDRGELKGDPFTYDDFTEEQLAALKGDPGDDGVSPTVSTEVTYYGNKVTFTDEDGDHTINVLDGMTATVKSALLNLFQHVVYVDDQGQTYYDALYDAFNPVLNVDYITVVFDPGTAAIYNTDELASLKQYLTVTAHYEDGTSATVDTYTLSGTLAAGTDTITVTYGGKSAIFTVTVVEWLVSISAVFTQGSAVIYDTDSLDTLKQYLVVTATYADSTTATVSDYTLSGTLAVGTSTITVSYGGKTTTFTVTVTGWDFEWYATSGSLPDAISNTGVTWGSNNEYADIKQPIYQIPYCDIDAEFEVAWLTIPTESQRQSMQIIFSNAAKYATKIYSPNNTTNVQFITRDSGGTSNSLTLNNYASTFHKYRVISQSGHCYLYVDGELLHEGYAYTSDYNFEPLVYTTAGTFNDYLAFKFIRWRALS